MQLESMYKNSSFVLHFATEYVVKSVSENVI